MAANEYYDSTGAPSTGSPGSSATMRAEFNKIEAGFSKMPKVSGNNNNLVSVNSGGSGLESVSATIAASRIGAELTANKDTEGGYVGLDGFKVRLKNTLGTVISFLTNANTGERTYTLPDKSGTVALTDDITGANSGTNTGDQTAATVPNTPDGNITAATVQGAINELDTNITALESNIDVVEANIDTVEANIDAVENRVSACSGRKNYIIDGSFYFWDEGSGPFNGATEYTATLWKKQSSVSTGVTTRQEFTAGQSLVPGNPVYYSRTVVISGNTSSSFVYKTHYIESVRTFAGETVTLSFYAKADVPKNISVELKQNFGSGGSAYTSTSSKLAVTSVWEKHEVTLTLPSLSGKTIGTGHNLTVNFWFDAGVDFNSRSDSLGNQSGTFDIAKVQLEKGPIATDFEYRSYGEEQALVRRYYRECFTYWGMTTTSASTLRLFPSSGEIARCYNTDEMRHPKTSLIQDAEGVSNSVSVYNNPAIKLTVSNISVSKYLGFYITVSTAASSSTVYTGVITLDARF